MKYITNVEELIKLRKNGNYVLANDIDCKNIRVPCLVGIFTGVINGNGYTISNLVLGDRVWGDEQTIALFRNMSRATITNISFQNIKVECQSECYQPRVGVIGGKCSDCVFSNVMVCATNDIAEMTPMFYELNNCTITGSKMMCNGSESPIAYYD